MNDSCAQGSTKKIGHLSQLAAPWPFSKVIQRVLDAFVDVGDVIDAAAYFEQVELDVVVFKRAPERVGRVGGLGNADFIAEDVDPLAVDIVRGFCVQETRNVFRDDNKSWIAWPPSATVLVQASPP
ncbi:Aste57867_1370 [Aphanomyces stellatus]|uniref:Aste57867_1370 protein n=1 Tax=Aphanomyces stellatus TaxID=120398 RepID=A0A485K995_9STRA|nr:hypothetical protein As57867_001369 [Aphanomyces stellatus]VFT78588.1 Aste57867_1370 [Aphanomyces stellatus]